MKDLYADIPEYRALVPVVGHGFTEISALVHSGRVTHFGYLADQLARGTTPAADMLSKGAMHLVNDRLERRHQDGLGWFEKTFWIDPQKQASHERSKNWKLMLAGLATHATVQLGSYAARKYLHGREARKINRFIFHTMRMVAEVDGHPMDLARTAAVDLVLGQLGVAGRERQELITAPAPASILELDPVIGAEEVARLALFHPAADIALVGGFEERRELLFALGSSKLGLSHSAMEHVVEVVRKDNEARSRYLNALQGLYTRTMLELNVDINVIRQRATTLAHFDPLEASRRRNRDLAKAGTLVTLTVAATQLPDPGQRMIASAALDLCRQVLVVGDGLDADAVDRASRLLV